MPNRSLPHWLTSPLAQRRASGIWAYAISFYGDVPTPRTLFTNYRARSKAEVLAALAATRVKVIERNTPKLDPKVTRWWISLGALAVGMTLMISAIASAH